MIASQPHDGKYEECGKNVYVSKSLCMPFFSGLGDTTVFSVPGEIIHGVQGGPPSRDNGVVQKIF